MSSLSSDEEEEWEEWEPSEEEWSSSSGDESSEDEGGQAARARKRKAKATGPTYEGSSFRGVYFHSGRWVAAISVSGRPQRLGRFDSEEAAARAYDEQAKQTHAPPVLNFLADGSLNPDRKKRGRLLARARPLSGSASTFRGVYFAKGRWVAAVSVNGQIERLGRFDSEEAAARAYDERAKQTRDAPVLNFLPDGSLNPDRKKPRVSAASMSGVPLLPDPGRLSIYRGVYFLKGRWVAAVSVNGQNKYLGRFDSEEAAARTYDEQAKELHDSLVLNFLPDGSLNPDRKKRGRGPARQRAAAEEDERTVAITERAEQETRSGSSRRRGRCLMVRKEKEDERTVSINEEEEAGEARPGKRGRRHGNALKEEEEDARTVEIKGEDDGMTLGVC